MELVWENCFRVNVTQGKVVCSAPAFIFTAIWIASISLLMFRQFCLLLVIKKDCKLVHFSTALEEERLSTEHIRRVVLCQDEEWLQD